MMTDITSTPPTAQLPVEVEAELNRYLSEIALLNEQIRRDQESIEQIKLETEEIKAETRAILASLRTLLPA